jgi:hypothetical protein
MIFLSLITVRKSMYDRYHPPIAVNQIRRDVETCRYFIVVEIKTVNEGDICQIRYLDNGETKWYNVYSVSMANSIIVEEE